MLKITLPWPSSALSPNSRSRWGKIKATKTARELARIAVIEGPGYGYCCNNPPMFSLTARLKISMYFNPPDKRHFDLDGLLSRCKPAMDGIFDAIGNNDRQIEIIEARLKCVVKGGCVTICVSEIEDGNIAEMEF